MLAVNANVLVYMGPPLIYSIYTYYHSQLFKFLYTFFLNDFLLVQKNEEDFAIWEADDIQHTAFLMMLIHFSIKIALSILDGEQKVKKVEVRQLLWDIYLYWILLGIIIGFTIFDLSFMPSDLFDLVDNDTNY